MNMNDSNRYRLLATEQEGDRPEGSPNLRFYLGPSLEQAMADAGNTAPYLGKFQLDGTEGPKTLQYLRELTERRLQKQKDEYLARREQSMARKEEELRQGWKALENAQTSIAHAAAEERIASQEAIQMVKEAETKEAATRAMIEEATRRAEEAKAVFQKAYDDQQAKLAEDRNRTEITKQAVVRTMGPQPRCIYCKRTGHLGMDCWDPHTRCGDHWCKVPLKHKSYHPLKRCRNSKGYDPTYGRLEHMNRQATRYGEPLFKGTNEARERLAREGRCFACGNLDHTY
jgi:hypothetical protein